MRKEKLPDELALITIFKERLAESMKNIDINAEYLAKLSGVSKATISLYLNKEKLIEPTQTTIYKLAMALNVDPAWLAALNPECCALIKPKSMLCDAMGTLNDAGLKKIEEYAEDLAHSKKYRRTG